MLVGIGSPPSVGVAVDSVVVVVSKGSVWIEGRAVNAGRVRAFFNLGLIGFTFSVIIRISRFDINVEGSCC